METEVNYKEDVLREGLQDPWFYDLPSKFTGWRHNQENAILHLLRSDKRYVLQIQPTGSGKSLCYMTDALLMPGRTLILTSGKGLQDQLFSEFCTNLPITVQKGKNAYYCNQLLKDKVYDLFAKCDFGPCNFGHRCEQREHGRCQFWGSIYRARRAKVVITNYSFWGSNKADILGQFDFLVCDEAHDSVMKLLSILAFRITREDLSKTKADIHWPNWKVENFDYWKWLLTLKESLELSTLKVKERCTPKQLVQDKVFRSQQRLLLNLKKLEDATPEQWCATGTQFDVQCDPIWPSDFSGGILFRGIPKVLMTSATVTMKTLDLLGIGKENIDKVEYPSSFPKVRRPITWVRTVRMHSKMTQADERIWLSRIDQIIRTRTDRKGIIHAVSYDRCRKILEHSEYKEFMFTHTSKNTQEIVKQFKESPAPAILVSPSVVTGYDFPYDECEYQIIGKIPFPDLRRPVDKMRKAVDPEFGVCFAAQNLVQAAGRGMRAPDDQCEVFIVDDMFGWFQSAYKHYLPQWFKETVTCASIIPKPLNKL